MEEEKQDSKQNSLWELIRYALIAMLIIIPFRMFIAQPYVVSGSSMDPTFKDGDYLIVDQLSKRFNEPERESVVIIKYPKDRSKFFIKRLIAFPNEKIEIKNGEVFIFNADYPEGFKIEDFYIVYKKKENFSMELKENEYFVMGDNRAGSSDSRIWGTLLKEDIVGTPIIRLFPFNKVNLWPGDF